VVHPEMHIFWLTKEFDVLEAIVNELDCEVLW
jgi:hypothetical protein